MNVELQILHFYCFELFCFRICTVLDFFNLQFTILFLSLYLRPKNLQNNEKLYFLLTEIQ